MANLKGFIKDYQGNIILPISRGELIFDALGNIALHSSIFKAEAAERDPDTKIIKTNTGRYGLMTPEDMLLIQEAIARISIIESETGISGSTGNGESIKLMLLDLIDKVGYYKGEVLGKDENNVDIILSTDTGIYKYVNDQIIAHLAQSDALKFKGTLGVGGNIQLLPTENIDNGDTYKVITLGTYNGISAKPGDLFIALYLSGGTYTWELVPSGDEQELFIKIQQVIDGNTIDKIISGTVLLQGANGISITYDESSKKITVSGAGSQTEYLLNLIKADIKELLNTVFGLDAQGNPGEEDYQPALPGLVYKTALLLEKINNAVKSMEELVAKDENDLLINKDELVTAGTVYEISSELATFITESNKKYLLAITIDLNVALTEELKNNISGTIIN